MSRTTLISSLKTVLLAAPVLVACGQGGGAVVVIPPGGLNLPDCSDGQLIAVAANGDLSCTQPITNNFSPPSCPAGTHALNAYDGKVECMPKGNGMTGSDLRTTIDRVVSDTTKLENSITTLKGSGGGNARFCGLTSPTNGAIKGNGITGVEAAAFLCKSAEGCGTGAHMCTVYEMFESASSGTIGQNSTIARAWVYMAAWQHSAKGAAQDDQYGGLADNCGGYTYPTGDKQWWGTGVEWKAASTGAKALHFYSGPGVMSCAAVQPIACCQ